MTETAAEIKSKFEAAKAKIAEKEKQLSDLEGHINDTKKIGDQEIEKREKKNAELTKTETELNSRAKTLRSEIEQLGDVKKLKDAVDAVSLKLDVVEEKDIIKMREMADFVSERNRKVYLVCFITVVINVAISVVGVVLSRL